MKVATRLFELHLKHAFRLSRGVSESRRNLLVEIADGGFVGRGEAAPIARYGQDVESSARAVAVMAERLGDPRFYHDAAQRAAVPGESAAEAAVDLALHDLLGQRLGVPLYELWGLDPGTTPPTSFTIGLDTPERVVEKVAEAGDFEILKIKLGSPRDREILEAVRAVTTQTLRVDANEGWSFDEALANLEWLAALGVEMVEQPLPAAELEASRELRKHSPLPIWADESVHRPADLPRIAEAFDGINLKLMKCGGLGPARELIATARAHGLGVMLGCMIESSIGITAAAHLSPLVDAADLDGNLLVTDDPFVGVRVVGGRLKLPDGPGLGVEAA
ncbi:MAG: dipeptide epimerase [Thermoanaerobaculia bacterium]|nr:dipeptide epimerase [Thermoanaerobaculia bacterium]